MSSKDLIIDNIITGLKDCNIIKKPYNEQGTYWHRFSSIKSFQGINVDIDLRFYFTHMTDVASAYYNVHLHITHPKIDTYDNLYSSRIQEPSPLSFLYDREILSETLDKMKQRLLELHFSKFSGTFLTTVPVLQTEIEFFEDIPNIIFKGEDCSICLEKTNTTTKCKHYLCVPCFQQINLIEEENEDDDDDEHLKRPCPICRKDIFYTTA